MGEFLLLDTTSAYFSQGKDRASATLGDWDNSHSRFSGFFKLATAVVV